MFDAEWRRKAEEKRKEQKTPPSSPSTTAQFPVPSLPSQILRNGMLSHQRGYQKRGDRTVKRDARTRAKCRRIFGSLALTSMLS